ncbi:MAG: DUF2170 family protein [Gallionella sp.]
MSDLLDELVLRLNTYSTPEGTTFFAELQDELIHVVCSNNEEFPINIVKTDMQILTVSHLFSEDEVLDGKLDELNKIMLQLNPSIPLSSVGLKDGQYILFGAMAVETLFENLAHELGVQAENVIELLEAVSPLLASNETRGIKL